MKGNFAKLITDYRIGASILILIVAALIVGWYDIHSDQETTDNATVQCDVVDVVTQVPGIAKNVDFVDDQSVNEGDLLVQIEPDVYRSRLAKAEAEVKIAEAAYNVALEEEKLAQLNARSNVEQSGSTILAAEAAIEIASQQIAETKATLSAAKSGLQLAQIQYDRIEHMFAEGTVPQADLDRMRNERSSQASLVEATEAKIRALENQRKAAMARLAEAKESSNVYTHSETKLISIAAEKAATSLAQVNVAKAERDLASLNFQRTQIQAPRSGIISNRNIGKGQYVEVGQPIASIVACADSARIVANYKETQVGAMEVGQSVEVKIDTYPHLIFSGVVESISGGSGATFSLLPPENATGNFTKVVQRIPVRIRLTDSPTHILRTGMSAVTTVYTKIQPQPENVTRNDYATRTKTD